MSSKTLALTAHAGRLRGAVIESSIGSLQVVDVFDVESSASPLPVSGPFDRVVATVEPGAAAFRLVDLPFRDRRRVEQAVGPTLEEHVPFSLDDGALAWDFVASGGEAGGATVLAAIADSGHLEQVRAALVAGGVDTAPQRLLWEPSVTLTAYRRAVGLEASFLVADFGDSGTVLARFERGRLAALRVLAPCDDTLTIRNAAWSLTTMADTADDEQRLVLGGRHGARHSAALAAALPALHVEALDPACPLHGFPAEDWREHTALVGLVMAISGDALPPSLDFAAGSHALFGLASLGELRDEAAPLLRWGAAAAVLAVLAVGIDYVQLFAERGKLAERAEGIYTSVMPSGSGGVGRKLKMEMRLRELSGRADTSLVGSAGSPLALLASLSRDVPRDLDVVVDQVEHVPPSAKVSGHAESFETVTRMQEALHKSGAFSRVEVKDVHASVSGGGVEFLLELSTPAAGSGT